MWDQIINIHPSELLSIKTKKIKVTMIDDLTNPIICPHSMNQQGVEN